MSSIVVAAISCGLFVLAIVPPRASRLLDRELRVVGPAAADRPQRQYMLGAAGVGLATWFALMSWGWAAIVIGAAAAVGWYLMLARLAAVVQARRQARLAAELPQLCDLLEVCLEAGLPLRVAADVVAA